MVHVRHLGVCALAVCACVSAATLAAAADDQPLDPAQAAKATAQVTQGPMTIERVHGGFLVAPDFRVTRMDRRTSELAGAYGGWLYDSTFLVGAGAYWLTDGSRNREIAYGGLVVGWFARGDRRVGFGAKALVGGGEATLTSTVTELAFPVGPFDGDGRGPRDPRSIVPLPVQPSLRTMNVRTRDGFFVAEPESTVFVRLTRNFRLTGGVGYRLIGGARGLNDRLRGVSGSVALQIGGGS